MNHPFLMHPPPPSWTELARNDHWIVDRDAARRIIRVRRTALPFAPDTDWKVHSALLGRAIAIYDRASHAILVDMREAPMRTDPAFEEGVRHLQRASAEGFARRAVLVRTAVGLLQVSRTARQNGGEAHVFQDENDALAYLGTPRDRK